MATRGIIGRFDRKIRTGRPLRVHRPDDARLSRGLLPPDDPNAPVHLQGTLLQIFLNLKKNYRSSDVPGEK